jgi:DNA modification methylase
VGDWSYRLNRCMIGDCRDSMRQLIADGVRVQMCVTSPPYWGLRDYRTPPVLWPGGWIGSLGLEPTVQMYVEHIVEVMRLVRELLTDDGTAWLNIGDSYNAYNGAAGPSSSLSRGAQTNERPDLPSGYGLRDKSLKPKDLCLIPARIALALQANCWWVRQDIVWHKPNPMPESMIDRCTKAHEYLFLLAKSERYYFDAAAIASEGSNRVSGNCVAIKGAEYDKMRTRVGLLAQRKIAYSEAHFAVMPPALVEPCILAGSRVGDIVFDPFFGSGTVGEVAQRLGRKWIGIDLQEAYAPLQDRRTAQQGFEL